MRRTFIAAGVVVLGVAGLPGAAQAGSDDGKVWVTRADQLRYQAADGKQSRVVITRSGRTVTVDDRVAVKAGKGCKPVKGDRTKVRCTLKKTPSKITVTLGDRNDSLVNKSDLKLHVYGGTGKDSITGGPRSDFIQGDSGNDKLYGKGGADSLYAGTGNDMVSGGDGDDWLHGGAGEDQLLGEGGKDTVAG